MKSYHQVILLSFTFFLTACSEDFFDQTVAIEVPEHTPLLAITSQLNAGDSTIWAYVTHSQGILENSQANPIENAIVELYRGGQLIEAIPFWGEQFYSKNLDMPFPSDQAEYQLKISAPGFDPIEATQQMPTTVPIISAVYEAEGALDLDGERVDEISIEFEDPAGEKNYYQLEVYIIYPQSTNNLWLHLLDPIAEELGRSQFLKDDSFEGKKYTWRAGFYPQHFEPGSEAKILVQLFSISRDKYFYERSVSLSQDADDNPFAEPVIIYGNVEGGLGVFTLSAKSEVVIEP